MHFQKLQKSLPKYQNFRIVRIFCFETEEKKISWNTIKKCQHLLYLHPDACILLYVYSAFVSGANQRTLLDHSSVLTSRKNELVQSTAGDDASQATSSFQEVAEMTDNAIWWTTRAFFHA